MFVIPISLALQIVLQAIGVGAAYCIYRFGSMEKYDANIKAVKATCEDFEFAFLGTIIFAYMIIWINIMPGYYKEQCMGLQGNVRANQMLYTLANGKPGEVSAVILYTEGKEGAYKSKAQAEGGHRGGHAASARHPQYTGMKIKSEGS